MKTIEKQFRTEIEEIGLKPYLLVAKMTSFSFHVRQKNNQVPTLRPCTTQYYCALQIFLERDLVTVDLDGNPVYPNSQVNLIFPYRLVQCVAEARI